MDILVCMGTFSYHEYILSSNIITILLDFRLSNCFFIANNMDLLVLPVMASYYDDNYLAFRTYTFILT